ncbi:transcriptional regulator GcvA [Acidisphaera sp. L21]|jgi:LysR family glycine cleavage system transcriptional activator|uniref:transcriptional regulator GcvA n=1 Tax=Acidisphaera sp. L21 TaxID=1641851 RepID=UPI00131EBE3D|nr:transcriptional regulator GcvA [Acidisphaera sp. L21]
MSANLPSLSALRTFEAAGRHMSFTRAALEMHITQSAVSRQIRGLEEMLGATLFNRTGQRVTLTDVGQGYLRDISSALERIQDSTLRLLTKHSGSMLTLATPPAFGMRWLIPRLPAFHKRHPEIMVSLLTRASIFDFAKEPVDAAIHYGHDDWPGAETVRLLGDTMTLVASPDYLGQRKPMNRPADLQNAVLLQHMRRPTAWADWLAHARMTGINAWAGPRFEHYYMLIQAALAGLGIALIPSIIVAEELGSGRLVQPFKTGYMGQDSYCLVYPETKRADPNLQRLRQWLVSEANACRQPCSSHDAGS